MYRLIIAEKPSVSQTIAYSIGANERIKDGKYSYYEGNGFLVANALGHLIGIGMPEDYGWEKSYACNGAMSGTSGESKRLEGIELFLSGVQYSGGIKYKTHVQDYGWQGWCYDGEMS